VATVYARLEELCRRTIDPRYASPFDSAMFALLYVLDRCEPFIAPDAATTALDAPNTYWAARFASRLVDDLSRSEARKAAKAALLFPRPHAARPICKQDQLRYRSR